MNFRGDRGKTNILSYYLEFPKLNKMDSFPHFPSLYLRHWLHYHCCEPSTSTVNENVVSKVSSAPTASLSFPFELQSLFVLYLRLLQYFMVLLKCCPHHFSKSKPLIINTNKNRGQEVLRFPSAFH